MSLGKIKAPLAEKLNAVSPGSYCFHKLWGIGKVAGWSLPQKKVEIDFEKKPGHEMALDLALKSLEFIEPDHFLVERYENLEKLRELAEKDPVELVRITLEGCNNELRPEELEKNLKGSVIPRDKWKKWWDGVRPKLTAAVEFAMPTAKGESIRLRRDAGNFAETIIEDYLFNKDLKARVRVLDAVKPERLVEERQVVAELVDLINKDIGSAGSVGLQQALELAVFRDQFVKNAELADDVLDNLVPLARILKESHESLYEVMGNIPAARQRAIYEVFPEAFDDLWIAEALAVFDKAGARATGEIGKYIKDRGRIGDLLDHVTKGLHTQTIQPDGLIWVCRNRKGDSESVFCMEVGSTMLAHIEYDHTEGGPSRTLRLKNLLMEDADLVRDFIRGNAVPEVRQFARNLLTSIAFPELDRKALMARMMDVGDKINHMIMELLHVEEARDPKKEQEPLFVSWESLDKKKQELDELVNVKIPQNKHNKTVFRAEGDLRENAGYQDAKEVERVLNRRRAELEKDISMAQATDFKGADTSAVSMGTKVTLAHEDGTQVDYTVLGAWDSDADKHIISYLSKAGKSLVGKKTGDTVKIIPIGKELEESMKVVDIQAVNP